MTDEERRQAAARLFEDAASALTRTVLSTPASSVDIMAYVLYALTTLTMAVELLSRNDASYDTWAASWTRCVGEVPSMPSTRAHWDATLQPAAEPVAVLVPGPVRTQ